MGYTKKSPSDFIRSDSPKATGRAVRNSVIAKTPPVEQVDSYKSWARVKGVKRTWIAYYSECGNLSMACNYAKIHPSTVHYWLAHDEDFVKDYDDATDMAVSILEHEARRRALAGSDRLLEFLLKSLKPEVYRERYEVKQEVAGDYVIDISNPSQAAITPAGHDTADEFLDEPPAV